MTRRGHTAALQVILVALCPLLELGQCSGSCADYAESVASKCPGHAEVAHAEVAHSEVAHQHACGHEPGASPEDHDCPYGEHNVDCICKGAVSAEYATDFEIDSNRWPFAYVSGDSDSVSVSYLSFRNRTFKQSASALVTLSGWEIRALIESLVV